MLCPDHNIKRRIYIAVISLWACVIFGLLLVFAYVVDTKYFYQLDSRFRASGEPNWLQTFMYVWVVFTIISIMLGHIIATGVLKGRNWARYCCLCIGVLSIPEALDSGGSFFQMVRASHFAFGAYALYLVFIGPGRRWFHRPCIPPI